MGYLQDYQYYMSGTECPESFLRWSALALAGAVCGKRVWVTHGEYFDIYPNLYVCLVGTPGSGKSVAKDTARDFLLETWPEYPLSAEIQSHQHICRSMATPEGCFTWKNHLGKLEEYRPFFAMPDELQLFFSTDKAGMMGFLVGVYSSKIFSTGFKVEAGLPQHIKNPYFSLLGCSTPEWFMGNLKQDLFSGGAGRRFLIVYDRKTVYKPRPQKPPHAGEAYARIINHLRCLKDLSGPSMVDPAAYPWWDKWYLSRDTWAHRDDPIILQAHETKHIMLLKVAHLLSLNDTPFQKIVTEEHFRIALAMLNELEPKVVRLTSGIGRNPLAGIGAELLEKISVCGGKVLEKKFRIQFFRNLRDGEWRELKEHYTQTNQLIETSVPDEHGTFRTLLFEPSVYVQEFPFSCPACGRVFRTQVSCCGKQAIRTVVSPPSGGTLPEPGSGQPLSGH